jgi:hypothetical protein
LRSLKCVLMYNSLPSFVFQVLLVLWFDNKSLVHGSSNWSLMLCKMVARPSPLFFSFFFFYFFFKVSFKFVCFRIFYFILLKVFPSLERYWQFFYSLEVLSQLWGEYCQLMLRLSGGGGFLQPCKNEEFESRKQFTVLT